MLIMGFVFAVVGGCVSLFLGSDITLTCQRSSDNSGGKVHVGLE